MQVLGSRIKEYRERYGWSARELAERCVAEGLPRWDRNVISNLENGRRENIAVTEWLSLARALSVPPVLLFIPLGAEDLVEITPGVQVHPDLALKWVTGAEQQTDSLQRTAGDSQAWFRAQVPLALYRSLNDAMEAMEDADGEVRRAEYTGDSERVQRAKASRLEQLTRLAEVLDDMADSGVRPPAMRSEWLHPIRELGLSKRPGDLPSAREDSDG